MRSGVIAGYACLVLCERVKAFGLESLRGVLCLADTHIAALAFTHLYFHWCHHGLTRIL